MIQDLPKLLPNLLKSLCLMKKIFLYLILATLFQNLKSQDTISISISDAVNFAITNNSISQNGDLHIQESQLNLTNNWDFRPTEINFRYGQLYTPENGWQLNINQDIDPIFQHSKKLKTSQIAYNLEVLNNNLNKKELELKTKSLYLNWIYLLNKLQIAKTKNEYINKRQDVISLQNDLGEKEPIEKALEQSQISLTETEYLEYLYEVDIAANQLRMIMNTSSYLTPSSKKLELYMINKPDDTSTYKSLYKTDILLKKQQFYESKTELDRAKYFPSLQIGFFVQNIASFSTMAGIQAGIKMPILGSSIKTEIKQSELLSKAANNEYNQALNKSTIEIETLILQLDKIFLKIRHYQDYALPASDMLINTASKKYQVEEITFEDFIKMIDEALNIRSEYFDCINNYNQTAIQLELYTN